MHGSLGGSIDESPKLYYLVLSVLMRVPSNFILLGSLNTDESPKGYCLVLSIDLLIESPDANDIGLMVL